MNTRLLTFIALFTITIGGIGVDLYSPSLPWIAEFMKVHQTLAQYTITTFLVGFAFGQLLFGVLADLYGRKWILVLGLAIFVVSSFLSVFATNIYMLMVMRCIQGFAAASCSIISKTLMTDTLSGKALHKALISLGIAWAVGPIVAPVVGGYLQHHFNWQANFYFYTAYSLLVLFTVLVFLKETLKSRVERKFRTVVQHYVVLLKHRAFMTGIISLGLGYALIIAFNVMGPFLIQRTLHYGPVTFGHMALLTGFAFFIGNMGSRFLIKHFSPMVVARFGLILLIIFGAFYVLESYFLPIRLWNLMIPTFLVMISTGLIFPNCMATCMSLFPNISGIASSLLGCVMYLTTMLASSVFSLIPLPNQRPYAWSLFCVLVVISGFLLLGFFPAVRRLQKKQT